MRKLDLAWAAGFFDGEGCTSVLAAQRDKYEYIRCGISQKNRPLLDKWFTIFNLGKVYQHKCREMHSWDCYKAEDVISVLNQLWPYLGEQKKLQAIKAYDRVFHGV